MDFQDLNKACPKENFSTRFLMSVWEAIFFILWMYFQDIMKFKSNLRINTRRRLFVLGVLLHNGKCLLAFKTLEKPSNMPRYFLFMISNILSKLTLMILLLTITRD
jgi:hypothetical protein